MAGNDPGTITGGRRRLQLAGEVLHRLYAGESVWLVHLDALAHDVESPGLELVERASARVAHNTGRLKVPDVDQSVVDVGERELLRMLFRSALMSLAIERSTAAYADAGPMY